MCMWFGFGVFVSVYVAEVARRVDDVADELFEMFCFWEGGEGG